MYYNIFSKDGIKSNIGSYITIVIIILNLVLFIYYKENGTNMIDNEINKILNRNPTDNNDNSSINNPSKKVKKSKKGKVIPILKLSNQI